MLYIPYFAAAAALFVISYFPMKREFHLDAPKSIEESYASWTRWKIRWYYFGFAFFIAGLFAIAVVGLLGNFIKN